MFLAADIGGTKTLIALGDEGGLRLQRRYENDAHESPAALIASFLREAQAMGLPAQAQASCLALAGPVGSGARSAPLTNRDWLIDAPALERALPIGEVQLLNDFAAAAAGIAGLGPEESVCLQAGKSDPRAATLALGPGTGLGVAVALPRTGRTALILASEAGHVGFAPANEEQQGLLAFLRARNSTSAHVAVETLVSGSGLAACHAYCAGNDSGLSAAQISARALDGSDSQCARALDLFLAIFGGFAGDMALCFLAQGGIYLAGGIVPKVLPRLLAGPFLAAFLDNPQHRQLLARTPVRAVLAEDIALRGALALARAIPG